MAAGLRLVCLFAAFSLVLGDVYMHQPRGSNNRLNERSANRNNANRIFDSQVRTDKSKRLFFCVQTNKIIAPSILDNRYVIVAS